VEVHGVASLCLETKMVPETTLIPQHQITVTITEGSAVKRINRKLAPEGEKLRTLRGDRYWNDFGRYFIVDTHTGCLVATHVKIADLAAELGVLAPWERIDATDGGEA
jgi:hypothetical protein